MNMLIQDNFLDSADKVRELALSLDFKSSEDYTVDVGWRGSRTDELYLYNNDFLLECDEKILNFVSEFYNLKGYGITSYFHLSYKRTKKTLPDYENKKYHFDPASHAGIIYLTPNPPQGTGTSILDGSKNEIISTENVYNRLVAYPAHYIHAPSDLFGDTKEDGRMTLTFFINKKTSWSV